MRGQLRRLERCFSRLDLPMCRQPPARPEDIDKLATKTGINPSKALREMWLYSNGSDVQPWFFSDGEESREFLNEVLTNGLSDSVFYFYSVKSSLKWWKLFREVDEANPGDWTYEPARYRPRLDPRVATQLVRHRQRLPIAGELLGSGELEIDAYPSPLGKYGQVLEFVHDPDDLWYVAASFEEFLDQSIACMEQSIAKDPEHARGLLEDPRTKDW